MKPVQLHVVMKETKNYLIVSEHFYSLQGEGATMGKPAVFLRLTGCNLMCGGIMGSQVGKTATWWCDTEPVWRKGQKYEFTALKELFDEKGYTQKLIDGAHLIITGGEPMLQIQEVISFIGVLYYTARMSKMPILEIETNGLIYHEHMKVFDFINVSPKLSNSGETFERRIDFDSMLKINSDPNSIFKFVVSSEEDLNEIKLNYGWIDPKRIWLMPAASTQEELAITLPMAAKMAIENGMNLSTRLQVHIWNQTTGV